MRRLPTSVVVIIVLLLILFGVSSSVLLASRQSLSLAQIAQATIIEATAVVAPTGEPLPLTPTSTIPWYVDLPPTERAVEELKEALRQSNIQTVTAMADLGITPPPLPTLDLSGPGVFPITNGRRPAGAGDIIDLSLNLLFWKGFEVSNVWTAPLEDVQVIIYAGHDRDTPQQGGVFAQWGEPGNFHPTRAHQYYPAPEGVASVRIVGAEGTVLLLSTSDGVTVQFDVLSGNYNSVSITPVPTVTIPEEPYPAPATPITLNPTSLSSSCRLCSASQNPKSKMV